MIKVVNAGKYNLGKASHGIYISYTGFVMLNTDTNEVYSLDGYFPFALKKKKFMEVCLSDGDYKYMKTIPATVKA